MQMIYWDQGCPVYLDQTKLPDQEVQVRSETVERLARGIEDLEIRGAPLIGVSAAYGMALSARIHLDAYKAGTLSREDFLSGILADEKRLRRTRPTAVNLFWALDRTLECIHTTFSQEDPPAVAKALLALAEKLRLEDEQTNRNMGAIGQKVLEDGDGVLTHCNAGALATAGYGTALGVIRAAVEAGKHIHVYADETRPLLQGARLTCWELMQDGIPVTLQSDGMAAVLMRQGKIQKVIVGADRIAANGDTANKIGTYGVAVLAAAHNIPFYVAAPESTIDRTLASGQLIPIEMRNPDELRFFRGQPTAPSAVDVFNPAFDVTDAHLIAGIITEKQLYLPEGGTFSL